MTKTKLQTETVNLGIFSYPGILLEDGKSFGVGFPQFYKMFFNTPKHGVKKVKELLYKAFGDNSNTLLKARTDLHSGAVYILTIDQFLACVKQLAHEGNAKAIKFSIDLAGVSLVEMNCVAFGIKFDIDDKLAWLKTRVDGQKHRRSFTDAIKYVTEENKEQLHYGYMTRMVYKAAKLLDDYLAHKKAGLKDFRDALTQEQLERILKVEDRAADSIMVDGLRVIPAIELAARYIRVA